MIKYLQISNSDPDFNKSIYYLNIGFLNELNSLKILDYSRINIIIHQVSKEFCVELNGLHESIININVYVEQYNFKTMNSTLLRHKIVDYCLFGLSELFSARLWDIKFLDTLKINLLDSKYRFITNTIKINQVSKKEFVKIYLEYKERVMMLFVDSYSNRELRNSIKLVNFNINPFLFNELFSTHRWNSLNELVFKSKDKKIEFIINLADENYKISYNKASMSEDEFFEYVSHIISA